MKKATKRNIDTTAFVKTLDIRLANVWKDLEEFSMLSNLASQTGGKLQPNTFSEIMVSILYRLLALSFPDSPLEDAIRLGMMTFTASIFFRWRGMKQRQAYLDNSFKEALAKLKKAPAQLPQALNLWLLVLWNANVADDPGQDIFSEWTIKVVRSLDIGSWTDAHDILKTVIWIDCLFDASSRRAFESILAKTKAKGSELDEGQV